ncbi:MAG: class I SAM-dependent rRNA methyltransferase [Bacteroidia bacterium]|nr:class I SAM-dependent rRNA methyltransferase [Bacteroidia bacterium]MDW8159239.1 class I SAM-dependent rRNA methyltransferase [Bacteroidia bacterium]
MVSWGKIVLKKKKERSVCNRHPWLYSGAIEYVENAKEGDIVEVYTAQKQLLGYGHYSPRSTIACRLFCFTAESQSIDAVFWRKKLENAWQYRQNLGIPQKTEAYRLVNAEGDYLPGLIIDIYQDTAVMQIRTAGMQCMKYTALSFLVERLGIAHVLEKGEILTESTWLKGNKREVFFKEYNYTFSAEPLEGQKTGFFLDQRENRKLVETLAAERYVLNAFSYTGSFGIYALGGRAKHVTSVDVSKAALEKAQKHVAMNFPYARNHTSIQSDCFDYLRQISKDSFDFIILDPPAFTKHISTVERAARGYKDLNLKAIQKIKAQGYLLTFSCSQHISPQLFRQIIFAAAADAGREVRIVQILGASPDHPIDIYHPEGEYLKGLLLQVE